MTDEEKDILAKKIFDTLEMEEFITWYIDGRFDAHFFNQKHGKDEILNDIKVMFKLNEL